MTALQLRRLSPVRRGKADRTAASSRSRAARSELGLQFVAAAAATWSADADDAFDFEL